MLDTQSLLAICGAALKGRRGAWRSPRVSRRTVKIELAQFQTRKVGWPQRPAVVNWRTQSSKH
jgi:hypothetical protein